MTENSFQTLIDSAIENTIVKLTSDVTVTESTIVSKNITIDLNGHTIKNTVDIWNENTKSWSLISVRNGGILTLLDSSDAGTGTLFAKENDCYAIDVRNGGMLIIESGTYIGNISSVYVHTGTAYINGGYYKVQQISSMNGYGETINCYDANFKNGTAKVIISGGSFYNFDPTDAAEPSDCNQNYLSKNTKMVYDDTTNSYVITKREFKIVATTSEKIEALGIKDGQLIFVQDKEKIAFDFNGTRVFYDHSNDLDDIYSKITTLENKDVEFEAQMKTKVDETTVQTMIEEYTESAMVIVEF
jgi:hypothetical protein